jgi:hypothetical protein
MSAALPKISFRIDVINDQLAEFESWFLVNLTSVTTGSVIQQSHAVMNVTLVKSDYPNGRIAFGVDSR